MEIISDNPTDIQELINKISATPDIKTRMPDDDVVELPGGFITKDGSLVKIAIVRELTGRDEEAMAKSGNKVLMLNTILTRGLEKLGYEIPTSNDLDSLLAGDREAILLGIRRMTFGRFIDGVVSCPTCGEKQDVKIDLEADVPTTELNDPINDRIFEIDLRAGRAVVGLPNGLVQRQVADAFTKTTAEQLSVFLGGCIISINDEPCMGTSTAADLGMMDRETLLVEIAKRNPGPRLEAVVKACKACGTDIAVPLSLADLFRI